MSGESQVTGLVAGATSTTAGIAVLPNTSGNIILTILSALLIIIGAAIIISFIAMKIAQKKLR